LRLTLQRKLGIFRFKMSALIISQTITSKILARIYGKGRGKVFTPKDFLDLAGHRTTRSILDRLTRQGTIRRVLPGVYDYPEYSNLLQALSSPDPDAIARAKARAQGWTILPSGETAMNLLGLSTQVPAKWEYFSDGPTRQYTWSGGTLAFKHRANKETSILSPKTALLVQALKTLGEKNVNQSIMVTLRTKFDAKELNRAIREAKYATSWVYDIIKRLAENSEPRDA